MKEGNLTKDNNSIERKKMRHFISADSSIVLIKNQELMKKINNNKVIGFYNDSSLYMTHEPEYLEDIEYIAWNQHFYQYYKDKKNLTSFEDLKVSFPKIKDLIYSLFQIEVNLNDFEMHQFSLYIDEHNRSSCSEGDPFGHVFRLNQNIELHSPFNSGYLIHTFENNHHRFAHFLFNEFEADYYLGYSSENFKIRNSFEQLESIGVGEQKYFDKLTIPKNLKKNDNQEAFQELAKQLNINQNLINRFFDDDNEIIMMDQRHLFPEKWLNSNCKMPIATNVIIYNHSNQKLLNIDLSDLKDFIENRVVKTYEYNYPLINEFIENNIIDDEDEIKPREDGLVLVHHKMITGDDIIDEMSEDEETW